jgi:hypothetical protein
LSKYQKSTQTKTPFFQYVTILADYKNKRISDLGDMVAMRGGNNTGRDGRGAI